MELIRLGNAVVVGVLPKQEPGPDGVPAVYDTVAIAAVLRPVKFRESQEAVGIRRRRLLRVIAKQLLAARDLAVAVTIETE